MTKAEKSLGYLPQVPRHPQTKKSTPGKDFLSKYKAASKSATNRKINLAVETKTRDRLTNNPSKAETQQDDHNPMSKLMKYLDDCPPLSFPDICDQCCTAPPPICSDNPNCHTFKECKRKTLAETCKYLPNRGPHIPSWLAHCGKVMSFDAYFQEPIAESNIENYRIHQVIIRFYMEDGSVEVIEPNTFDPGFQQGRLIRRHRIPLPIPKDTCVPAPTYVPPYFENFYTIEHFNVGCEVELYGKVFLICGCNEPTRKYLNKLGISVPKNFEMPEDPYTIYRKDRITSQFARRARIDINQGKSKNFLTKNPKVLRFWAFWDDRCQEGGHLRRFILHFYLEDDTVEIKEIPFNNPTEVFPTFLSRGKLLKDYKGLVTSPGDKEGASFILNLDGVKDASFLNHSYLEDRLCPGIDEIPHVKDNDLGIGAVLDVYGRAFILTECDQFTKVYYREKYGIEDFTPLEVTDEDTGKKVLPRMKTPPHTGIGDEEETRQNWNKLEGHPPKRDELRLLIMANDILGFDAQLHNSQHKVNSDRRFIINYYMADETLKIFERKHPNTGFEAGTFLQRTKPRKSGTGVAPRYEHGEENEYYQPEDMYVGNILYLNGHKFLLTAADALTHDYMEKNSHLFPQSNLCTILNKVREAFGATQASDLLHIFSEKDSCLNGVIDVEGFRDLVLQLTKCALNEHEVIRLSRAFRVDAEEPGPDMQTLQAVIHTELSKKGYDRFYLERIEYTLRYHDPCRLGRVDRHDLRATLLGAKVPLPREIINFLVDKFPPADDCDRVNYCDLLCFLDYGKNPAPKTTPSPITCILKYLEPKRPSKIFCVNYREFLDAVCPNYKCSLPEVCCPPCCDDSNSCKEEIPSDEREIDERVLAGQVITDNNPWNEQDRCNTEDNCEFQMTMDPNKLNELGQPISPYINRELEKSYQPTRNNCAPLDGEYADLLQSGDHIGFEDVYKSAARDPIPVFEDFRQRNYQPLTQSKNCYTY